MRLLNHILKRIFLCSFFVFSLQQTCYAEAEELLNAAVSEAASIVDIASKAAEETAKAGFIEIAKDVAKDIADVSPYIALTCKIYSIVNEIRSHNFPTDQEEAHARYVAKQYAWYAAEDGLYECLLANMEVSDRTKSGIPTVCAKIAAMLGAYGGKEEVNNMTNNYNQYRKSMG